MKFTSALKTYFRRQRKVQLLKTFLPLQLECGKILQFPYLILSVICFEKKLFVQNCAFKIETNKMSCLMYLVVQRVVNLIRILRSVDVKVGCTTS